jgi:hypothetical protein
MHRLVIWNAIENLAQDLFLHLLQPRLGYFDQADCAVPLGENAVVVVMQLGGGIRRLRDFGVEPLAVGEPFEFAHA